MTEPTARLRTAIAGRYTIERQLGMGGMATVYLAHDAKHDRKVALKVLKPELAAVLGAERFVQEIKTTANLQHPHILPLFDSGEADGFLFYVMPFIDGETLRGKLNRETQLGIEDAVRITCDVADALDYAHRHGVVHRDIKPENILLHDGRPLVADFGIALAVSAAAGGRVTETGLSLGTPHYMSPEQATADKHITNRSDVYSLGCVLYEMLTGDPPHTGSSAQAIIMKIVTDDARPVTQLRKAVPPHVAEALAKSLEKLAADRFESAKAFADALANPSFTRGTTAATASVMAARRPIMQLALAAIAVLGIAGAAVAWLRPRPVPLVARFNISLVDSVTPNGYGLRTQAAISPDGSLIVFRHNQGERPQLFVKRRDALEVQALAGTEGASGPFFSPDGEWIGFFVSGQLRKISRTGGGAVTLSDSSQSGGNVFGAWLDDGSIVFTDRSWNLRRVPAAGGAAPVLIRNARVRGGAVLMPAGLPDGRGVLVTGCNANCAESAVYVWDARTDSLRMLQDAALGAWYAPTGHVLYLTREGTLLGAPWDAGAMRPSGPAVPILDRIQPPGLTFSAEGTALYVLGEPLFESGPVPNAQAVWVDRTGKVEPVDSAWKVNTGNANWGLALSPDGRRLAIRLNTGQGQDIWVKQLPASPVSRLTFFDGEDRAPRWTPDGQAITYISARPLPGDTGQGGDYNVWSQQADGTGDPRLVWHDPRSVTEALWTRDGQALVLRTSGPAGAPGQRDILLARPGTDSVSRPLLAASHDEQGPALSPDGRWLAYVSNETGRNEVFIRTFPDVDKGKWQVSNGAGNAPVWAHNGRELFYVAGGGLNVVEIRPGPPFSVSSPRRLFATPQNVRGGSPIGGLWDISRDDRRFLMVRNIPASGDAAAAKTTLVMVQNFFEELKARTRK